MLEWARRLQAIAQNGLTFSQDPFDRERYTQLRELVEEMLATHLQLPRTEAAALWDGERGYATPKVDVRGGIFRDTQVLLVRERSDGRWTLPGGWADAGETPSEAARREVREESGFDVEITRLLAGLAPDSGEAARQLVEHVTAQVERCLRGRSAGLRNGTLSRRTT